MGEEAGVGEHGEAHDHPVDPDRVAHARSRLPSQEGAARLASVLSLIADPTRARVLYALDVVEELCVGDLALRDARKAGSSTTA